MKVQELLNEARVKGWPYQEKRHAKTGELQKVILELSGSDSAAMTRLAKRYMRLDASMKKAQDMRNELNATAKAMGDQLFDANDVVVTRIIETVQYTLQLTAAQKAEHKEPKKSINYEAAFKALAALVPELEEQAKALIEAHTELVPPKDTPTALKVSVKEGLWDGITKVLKQFTRKMMDWAKGYDKKLADIKKAFPV